MKPIVGNIAGKESQPIKKEVNVTKDKNIKKNLKKIKKMMIMTMMISKWIKHGFTMT